MAKIIIADLSKESITQREYDYKKEKHFGRGLAVKLVEEFVPAQAGYLSPENAFVIVPGLLTGTKAPSATRATAAAKGENGFRIASFTGDVPQKMASLDIAALVVLGKYEKGNALIVLDSDGVVLESRPELEDKVVAEIVDDLRKEFGPCSAIIGGGKAADMQLPLSGFFNTYPEGTPRFTCPRSGFGDVIGSKQLRAVVVCEGNYFNAPCADAEKLQKNGKDLASIIVSNHICGEALPGLGSITIMHLLKNKERLPAIDRSHREASSKGEHINYCCAPMCVVGCLNRQGPTNGDYYAAPEESEVRAALNNCFGIDELDFARKVNAKAFEMGFNATELIYTIRLYAVACNESVNRDNIMDYVCQIEKGNVIGRLLGSGTEKLASLFKDREDVQKLVSRKAIDEEQNFNIVLSKPYEDCTEECGIDMLYKEVFALENMGICIFTAFASINSERALADLAAMASSRIGREISVRELLDYSEECINDELKYAKEFGVSVIKKNIPEFTKVLYRYFGA